MLAKKFFKIDVCDKIFKFSRSKISQVEKISHQPINKFTLYIVHIWKNPQATIAQATFSNSLKFLLFTILTYNKPKSAISLYLIYSL